MLKSLSISNYALISKLTIDFSNGMSVITGETGAGKSIILAALSLIQGQRADLRVIRKQEEKAVVEAVFFIESYALQDFFEENELDYSSECIIRRELSVSGKSRAFINDTPVSLHILRELSLQLIDIHSQHENLLLIKEDYQLQVLDAIAQNEDEIVAYKMAFLHWKEKKNELSELIKKAQNQKSDIDYLQFQYQQLDEAQLNTIDQEELESEQEILSHVEEIKTTLQSLGANFDEGDNNIINLNKDSLSLLSQITDYYPKSNDWYERLSSIYIELRDIANEISSSQGQLDYDPVQLEHINSRLDLLYSLQKKFQVNSVLELIDIRESLRKQLDEIEGFDDKIEAARKQVDLKFEILTKASDKLTQSRTLAKPTIESYLVDQLQQLGMVDVQVEVAMQEGEDFTESGKDRVSYLFTANKNHDLQALAEIASGGEMSRFMLAIKSLLAKKSSIPTIIFDEIDTGVSGEVAVKVAKIMQLMGKSSQIIVITHLPQIAAKAHHHYRVYKESPNDTAETFIELLDEPNRIDELALMLSGNKSSEAAILNAKELLGL